MTRKQSFRRADSGVSLGQNNNNNGTIALFGLGSKTANPFLRLALDAGYNVRALLLMQQENNHRSHHQHYHRSEHQQRQQKEDATSSSSSSSEAIATQLLEEFADQPAVKFVRAESVYDVEACRRVLRGADYVVCMMNKDAPFVCSSSSMEISNKDSNNKKKTKNKQNNQYKGSKKNKQQALPLIDKKRPLATFLEMLYPLMKQQSSVQVFLYQVRTLYHATHAASVTRYYCNCVCALPF